MNPVTSAKITIAVGERVIEVSLDDARSLGVLDNVVKQGVEKMFGSSGNLHNPQDAPLVKDLTGLAKAARLGWYTAEGINPPPEQ